MASNQHDIRIVVDEFMRADKSLTGSGPFVQTEQVDEYEWKRLIVQNGVVVDAQLRVIAYPSSQKREFRILILHEDNCISRLDFVFDRDGTHINDFKRPMGYPSMPIRQPHYHPWQGNRQLGTMDRYPRKLLYAFEIDSKIDTLDRCFKWFCDDVNISFTSEDVPDWPSREKLL